MCAERKQIGSRAYKSLVVYQRCVLPPLRLDDGIGAAEGSTPVLEFVAGRA